MECRNSAELIGLLASTHEEDCGWRSLFCDPSFAYLQDTSPFALNNSFIRRSCNLLQLFSRRLLSMCTKPCTTTVSVSLTLIRSIECLLCYGDIKVKELDKETVQLIIEWHDNYVPSVKLFDDIVTAIQSFLSSSAAENSVQYKDSDLNSWKNGMSLLDAFVLIARTIRDRELHDTQLQQFTSALDANVLILSFIVAIYGWTADDVQSADLLMQSDSSTSSASPSVTEQNTIASMTSVPQELISCSNCHRRLNLRLFINSESNIIDLAHQHRHYCPIVSLHHLDAVTSSSPTASSLITTTTTTTSNAQREEQPHGRTVSCSHNANEAAVVTCASTVAGSKTDNVLLSGWQIILNSTADFSYFHNTAAVHQLSIVRPSCKPLVGHDYPSSNHPRKRGISLPADVQIVAGSLPVESSMIGSTSGTNETFPTAMHEMDNSMSAHDAFIKIRKVLGFATK
jgi:hypothetical protein